MITTIYMCIAADVGNVLQNLADRGHKLQSALYASSLSCVGRQALVLHPFLQYVVVFWSLLCACASANWSTVQVMFAWLECRVTLPHVEQ